MSLLGYQPLYPPTFTHPLGTLVSHCVPSPPLRDPGVTVHTPPTHLSGAQGSRSGPLRHPTGPQTSPSPHRLSPLAELQTPLTLEDPGSPRPPAALTVSRGPVPTHPRGSRPPLTLSRGRSPLSAAGRARTHRPGPTI